MISSEPAEWKTGALAPQKKGETMRDRITTTRRSWVAGRLNLTENGKSSQMKTVSQFSCWLGGLLAVLLTVSGGPVCAMEATIGGTLPAPLPLFPADNWWNLDISAWPVDPNSASYVSFINNGSTRHLHPDLGGNAPTPEDPNACYGMPYVVVSGVSSADLVPVVFYYADESDGVDHVTNTSFPFYPIPAQAITQPYWIEGGDPGNVDLRSSQDRHLLIVDYERNHLYELYNVYFNPAQGRWYGGSGAFFDMNTNDRRPEGWTSADAAGLAILPGLVRYDEVYDDAAAPEIQHAFRVTVRATQGHVYPASHTAGSTSGALPMGARLRLKASVDVTQRTADPHMQKIFRAMQKYGLLVADNGSDMFITGTYDTRWDNDIVNPAFYTLTASDFEVTQLGYNPPSGVPQLSSVTASPSVVTGGQNSTGTVSLTAPAPAGGATIALGSDKPSATVPANVLVSAGAGSAAFPIATTPVAASVTATISASYSGITKTTTVTIKPPVPLLLTLSPSTVNAGSSSTGTVTLNGAAPAGGTVVMLSSSKPSVASVPASVTVPPGSSSATFIVNTSPGSPNTSVTVSATAGGVTKSATLSVRKHRR